MHMRKMVKAICLALSLMLLVNLAGFEVLAADVSSQQDKADGKDTKTSEKQDEKQDEKPAPEPETDANENTKNDEPGEEEKIPSLGEEADKADKTEGTDEPEDERESQAEEKTDDKLKDPEADSEPAIENEPEKENDVQKKQEEEKDPSVDEQAQETQTVGGNVEGITAKPAEKSDKQLKISWQRVADAQKYQVKVLKYSNNTLVRESDTTDTDLEIQVTQGEKYYIEVHALKEGEDGVTEIAAGKIPAVLLAKPSVKSTAGSSDIKLSWKSVTGADKYQVTQDKKTKDVSGTSYEVKKLKKNTKYSFSVQAVCKFTHDGKTYNYTSETVKLNVTTKKEKPAKVKKLAAIDGNESAILTWSKASRAESYIIYRYNATKKKWEVVKKDVKKLTYTDKKLKQGKIYKYRVAAYNNGGTGEKSSTVSVSVRKTPAKIRSIGYKAVIKSRAPLFTSKTSKKRVKYLKPGTRVTTTDYGRGRYQIQVGGKNYWVSAIRLRFTSSIWTTKDYSTKVKEDFVNKKGYKSKTKYLIWISHYTQRVIIYKGSKGKWKVVRSGQCATGLHNTMTPKGVWSIIRKSKGFFYRYTYEKPAVYFKTGIAFHSRIKKYSGGYSDATIGRPKSHGCVRLMDSEINYIYKYCPKGTTVVSY
jgi:hypothetical protein